MASVSSLDADMRNLRLSRYTPQAANEARAWIEKTLGEPLTSGDLLDALRDGVALCKLANAAIQPQHGAIKFKASPMPFIQMENISHFLKACEMPPLSMPAHDRFLTVDLFEQKDPAQVLQCLGAFSRQANKINPSRFPTAIGAKKAGTAMSPSATGGYTTNGASFRRPASPTKPSASMPGTTRAMSPALTGGSASSQNGTKSPSGPVSSWSKKSDESKTTPAWNIHQYGYIGGASQGNQGISFGARRQITSQAPAVPSLAEKEKLRKEKEAEAQKQRQLEVEQESQRRRMAEEEEERARQEEEQRWEEETRRQREQERQRLEAQKREWEDQERRWKEEEEARRKEDAALQASMSVKKAPEKPRVPSSGVLRGQTLAEYQREQAALSRSTGSNAEPVETPEQKRVRELEKQLEEARERERQYQAEREERLRKGGQDETSRPSTAEDARPQSADQSDVSWAGDEREYLRQQWQSARPTGVGASRPLPQPQAPPSLPQRALPDPVAEPASVPEPAPPALPVRSQPSGSSIPFSSRPLPTPEKAPEPFEPEQRKPNRTDQFLSEHTAPSNPSPRISSSLEAGDTSLEQSQLRDNRLASQQKTKAGGWASKSLLEREMERERERQKEWEANQQAVKDAPRDATEGTGPGQTWSNAQYGYIGGDGMNRGSSAGSGINIGGRRQIIGPRPQGPR